MFHYVSRNWLTWSKLCCGNSTEFYGHGDIRDSHVKKMTGRFILLLFFFDLYFTGMRWRNSEIVPNAARARYLASSQTSAGDTPGVTFGFNLGHALWNILYPSHRHGLATLLLIVLDPIPLKYAVTSPDLAMQLTLSCTQWASRPKISRGPLVYL